VHRGGKYQLSSQDLKSSLLLGSVRELAIFMEPGWGLRIQIPDIFVTHVRSPVDYVSIGTAGSLKIALPYHNFIFLN
jgi:hypothetical protein